MLGAIIGDIVGSVYERRGNAVRWPDFELLGPKSRFTDDTVLTVATADALLHDRDYATAYREWGRRHRGAGYGGMFRQWLRAEHPRPYGSFGNGSAMRVSPVGWLCEGEDAVLAEAERSAAVTHDHPEGIRGAQAVALAVYLARTGSDRVDMIEAIESTFGYDLSRPWEEVHAVHVFDVTCQGTVPPALQACLEADDYEGAVRLAVSLGGDADTLAAVAGSVAEAYFDGVPARLREEARARVAPEMWAVVEEFEAAVGRGGRRLGA